MLVGLIVCDAVIVVDGDRVILSVFVAVIVKEGVCVEDVVELIVFVIVCVTVPDRDAVLEGDTELEAVTEDVAVFVTVLLAV